MGFGVPASAAQVTAAITGTVDVTGSAVTTAAGSVIDRATKDPASILNEAVAGGLLPTNVPFAAATTRSSFALAAAISVATNAIGSISPLIVPAAGSRLVLRTHLATMSRASAALALYRWVNGARGNLLWYGYGYNTGAYPWGYFALGQNEGLEFVCTNNLAGAIDQAAALSINLDIINA